MDHERTAQLVTDWIALWNGDLAQAERIVSPEFVSHAAPLVGGAADTNRGRDLLATWVTGIHRALDGLVFRVELRPIVDADMVAVRWHATGRYAGGFAGATAAEGTPVEFYGTDTLRLDSAGRIAEYWVNADSLWFVQQLGFVQVPALNPST